MLIIICYFFLIIWVVVEYIKSFGVLGFPWVSLANSQTDYLILIQNADRYIWNYFLDCIR